MYVITYVWVCIYTYIHTVEALYKNNHGSSTGASRSCGCCVLVQCVDCMYICIYTYVYIRNYIHVHTWHDLQGSSGVKKSPHIVLWWFWPAARTLDDWALDRSLFHWKRKHLESYQLLRHVCTHLENTKHLVIYLNTARRRTQNAQQTPKEKQARCKCMVRKLSHPH